MYLSYLGQKHFDIPGVMKDLKKVPVHKPTTGLLAYLNFTFGDYDLDISFDDSEFSSFVNDFYKYSRNYEDGEKVVTQ